MHIGHLFFKTHGRISRKTWWLSNAACWLLSLATLAIWHRYGLHDAIFGVLLTFFFFWLKINVNIKRLHDRGKEGWSVFWGVVMGELPIVGIVYSVVGFGIMRGSEGMNAHGDPP